MLLYQGTELSFGRFHNAQSVWIYKKNQIIFLESVFHLWHHLWCLTNGTIRCKRYLTWWWGLFVPTEVWNSNWFASCKLFAHYLYKLDPSALNGVHGNTVCQFYVDTIEGASIFPEFWLLPQRVTQQNLYNQRLYSYCCFILSIWRYFLIVRFCCFAKGQTFHASVCCIATSNQINILQSFYYTLRAHDNNLILASVLLLPIYIFFKKTNVLSQSIVVLTYWASVQTRSRTYVCHALLFHCSTCLINFSCYLAAKSIKHTPTWYKCVLNLSFATFASILWTCIAITWINPLTMSAVISLV